MHHGLRNLLGDAEQPLAAVHLGPHVLGVDAGRNPEHDQIIEQIGAFPHDGLGVAAHGVDHHLDGFLGELLGHLAAARTQQARRPRGRRIGALGGDDGLMQAVERISHAGHNKPIRLKVY